MRTGISGDGASAVGLGETSLMWHYFRLPSLWVALTLMGALQLRVVMVSRRLNLYL